MFIDTHTHIIPDVDDGSLNIEMSMEMAREMARQNVSVIFATSHSFAYLDGMEAVMPAYELLLSEIKKENLPCKIYLGCEILCMPRMMEDILLKLKQGYFPTMNGTKYVLVEFTLWNMDFPDVASCVMQLLEAGWIPLLAHVERYVYTWATIENVLFFKNLGCLVQINAYSLCEETDASIQSMAKELLACKLVDVIGSDSHGSRRRPPRLERGIAYMYENYEKEYIDQITQTNAVRYFELS